MIIDRTGVKNQARELISTSKPSMLVAGLLYTLLSALVAWLSLRLTGIDTETMARLAESYAAGNTELMMRLLERAMPTGLESLVDILLRLAAYVVGVGFVIFTINSIRQTEPVLGNLLDGFGMLGRILLLMFLEYFFISLWSLLFVIPGIIAAYRYSFAVYLLIDHPEMSPMDCIRESKRLTSGYKKQLFMLDLSFILWQLLSWVPIIGYAVEIYLLPYTETSRVLYYEQICGKAMRYSAEYAEP
ncbi:MAG: DUF975 family protein [Oscillospiraceae bacterium]|nr:DUF975 family protein [Oscillospiraceae bacterium]